MFKPMKLIKNIMLANINPHPRDSNISFEENGHKYTIKNFPTPVSVTSIIHKFFTPFNADAIIKKMMASNNWSKSEYFGRTSESIKEEWNNSTDLGTLMHKDIENYFNGDTVVNPNNKEFSLFTNFWNDIKTQYPSFRPYRTEWLIYDEDIGLAGSIDCVLSDNNGNLIILDWKRSKKIQMTNSFERGYPPFDHYDNCNYSHYSLQLNFYRHMLQTKYNKNVIYMMLVILHPNQTSYICHPVSNIDLSGVWLPALTK